MTILNQHSLMALVAGCFLVACSGTGSVASNDSEGSSSVTSEDVVSTQSAKNVVSETGGAISQSELTETLDTITTGSGEVLVNLGEVVTALGEGLPLTARSLDVNQDYLSTTAQGASSATTQLGTTVVSAGDTIANLDALPVFVQLNNQTGVLTFTGETVSDLGGKVENVGQWLAFHTSDQGGIYGLTESVSVMTAPILVQAGDMIDLKGHALILVNDLGEMQTAVPSLVYLSSTSLKQGTTALLMNADGTVNNLGTVFVGEHGMTALLFNELSQQDGSLSALKEQLQDTLNGEQLAGVGDLDLGGGLYTDVQGNLTVVTQSLGDVLSLDTGLLASLELDSTLLNLSDLDATSMPLKDLLGSTAQSLTTLVGSLTGMTVETVSLSSVSGSLLADDTLSVSNSTETSQLLNYLSANVLTPVLGQ